EEGHDEEEEEDELYREVNINQGRDVLEIYMQDFWAIATVHHHSIRFKMDNKKHIVNLESFREMLHICPRIPHQPFVEPPFKEEILAFLWFLGHSRAIRRLTDVNINKSHQPWRSFAAIINKCLTGKSSGYDSLRLSQAQILWGLYHKRNVNFAYLMWEDFVYQVEHKDTKKSNEMYYPRFTKVIIHYFMSKDPSIPRRNKTRSSSDTTITLPTDVAGPRLTTFEKGKQAAKASKSMSLSALSEVAMTEVQQLKLATKRSLQQTNISQASGFGADEGTGTLLGVPDVPTDESEKEISWNSTDEEGDDDEGKDDDGEEGDGDDDDEDDDGKEGNDDDDDQEDEGDDEEDDEEEGETRNEESFDPIPKTPKNIDDEGNGEENLRTYVGKEEGYNEEEDGDELYRDVNINQGRENDEFLKTIDENMQKIIKEQVKEQVKRNLYKALVEAYETDKIILDTYGDTVTLKRRHDDDADKDEEPSVGSDRGPKRR
nr:hypothetical protein [Tanacetum cinerariifolium]